MWGMPCKVPCFFIPITPLSHLFTPHTWVEVLLCDNNRMGLIITYLNWARLRSCFWIWKSPGMWQLPPSAESLSPILASVMGAQDSELGSQLCSLLCAFKICGFLEQARLLPPSCSFEGCHLVICPACTEISPWMSMRDINLHDGIIYAQDEPPFFQHGKTTMWLSCLVEIMWSYCAYKNQTITERWQAMLANLTTWKWSFHNNWWTPF